MKRSLLKIQTIPIALLLISRETNTDSNHFQSNQENVSPHKCFSKTQTLFSRLFPYQNSHSFADWSFRWNKKIPSKLELEQAFHSAQSIEQMLKIFHHFEAYCEENDKSLGIASAKMACKICNEDKDPELMLRFSKKASEILFPYEKHFCDVNSFDDKFWELHVIVMRNLLISGIACNKLRMYDESLDYLNRARKVGSSLESCENASVLRELCVIENYLAVGKTEIGTSEEEIVSHLRRYVEIQERIAVEYSINLGNSCKVLALRYFRIFEFEEALPYCLKALKILKRHFGDGSLEVAEIRSLLGRIYGSVGKYEKGIEELEIGMSIWRDFDTSSDKLVEDEIRSAKYRIMLGRYKQGVESLVAIVSRGIKNKVLRALAFVTMAEGYCYQGRFADARRCAEIAGGICDEKEDQESEPGCFAHIFMELSIVYEKMNEPEIAMLYLQRLLVTNEKLPIKFLSIVTARYFTLICSTGKVTEGIPHLEVAVQDLKERFGSKHFQVGNVYWYLGYAYLILREPETAAKFLIESKDIMDATVGPHHENSIIACQGLVAAYSDMGSYSEAIEIQEMVVERLKGKEPRAQDELDAAVILLEDIKKKAGL